MGLFDNPDSGGLGAGQVVASGLQGLVEAYKMKLQQAQEESKIRQSGFNSAMDANTAMSKIAEDKRQFDAPPTFHDIPYVGADGKPTTLVVGYKGNHIVSLTPKGTSGTAAKSAQDALHNAAGAFSALDDSLNLAKQFAPQSSQTGAILKAPMSYLRSKLMQTSGENNLADKVKEAATLYATAVNKAGGGRMSDAEINNMATAMGGHGIGDTVDNLSIKHSQLKDNLAIKLGVPRGDIEAYVDQYKKANENKIPAPLQNALNASKGTPPASTPNPKPDNMSPAEAELRRRGIL
jgi:hypothetical protein